MSDIYILARPDLRIPMPDRGGRLFGAEGEAIDPHMLFYANLIEGGDIIRQAETAAPPTTRKG
jgi:hypothetical protein